MLTQLPRFVGVTLLFVLEILFNLLGVASIYHQAILFHSFRQLFQRPLAVSCIFPAHDGVDLDLCPSLSPQECVNVIFGTYFAKAKLYTLVWVGDIFECEQRFLFIGAGTVMVPNFWRWHFREHIRVFSQLELKLRDHCLVPPVGIKLLKSLD